ncbi:DNA repair protein RecO [Sporomusa acidovorans]|uniref:DNA repair protein RecO n=1 Tax=Sporomusa acidovorans (strain ATCC 49682 / DSM 3132 / Mol) TaxID=1123286 RepID=A0ABZ3J4K7_SPOA4|nr:DNA repair protein RecO [Sporomusa acidovorans]OZC23135.1 DNA repair protein RecO [Sporomusa acidovorans DSM 3132]SDF06437.1 DNA replication and repair protein RecO [Sporomusa acidovorans]
MAIEYLMEAILLAARDWGATDRMVTLFSREHGIITAMAYDVRKPKNKLGGGLQPFTHFNLLMTSGKGMDIIKQCEIQTSFKEIREDLTRLAYANFIAELAIGLWPERQAEPTAYDMLLAILALLAVRNPRIAALIGAWQLMVLAGFQPEFEYCTHCGRKLEWPAAFSFAEGGGTCLACSLPDAPVFDRLTKDFLAKLLAIDLKQPGEFTVHTRLITATESLLYGFVRYQLDRPLKSLDFINKIK